MRIRLGLGLSLSLSLVQFLLEKCSVQLLYNGVLGHPVIRQNPHEEPHEFRDNVAIDVKDLLVEFRQVPNIPKVIRLLGDGPLASHGPFLKAQAHIAADGATSKVGQQLRRVYNIHGHGWHPVHFRIAKQLGEIVPVQSPFHVVEAAVRAVETLVDVLHVDAKRRIGQPAILRHPRHAAMDHKHGKKRQRERLAERSHPGKCLPWHDLSITIDIKKGNVLFKWCHLTYCCLALLSLYSLLIMPSSLWGLPGINTTRTRISSLHRPSLSN